MWSIKTCPPNILTNTSKHAALITQGQEDQYKAALSTGSMTCFGAAPKILIKTLVRKSSKNQAKAGGYLVAERLLFTVDPEQHSFLRVVALHLHHNVFLVGLFVAETHETPKSRKHTLQKTQVLSSYILKWRL